MIHPRSLGQWLQGRGRCGELCWTRLPVKKTSPQPLLCWQQYHVPGAALLWNITPPPPILSQFFPNFKCLWRPPRLVRFSSPSGYILPRSPPVEYWVGFFIFFQSVFWETPYWTSTSKSWTNLETLSSKSEQKLNFMTKVHLPNLHQTVVDTFLIINFNNSNNFNKIWVAIFTCQSNINQVY